MISRAGFVAVVGRPNSGKSTLLNTIIGENLALVSHKANATRKTMNFIISHTNKHHEQCQINFVDTPGIHKKEKLLNQFMLDSALKAMSDCDVCVFLSAVGDSLKYYEEFLNLYPKKHILVLSKIDTITHKDLAVEISKYQPYAERFLALIPLSTKKNLNITQLLDSVSENLPHSNALFDEDDLTTHTMREITKEMIRQSVFENLSDEIPYESDVLISSFIHKQNINEIFAKLYVRKHSQKIITIGKNGQTIKRISMQARQKIEELLQERVFLKIDVVVNKDWLNDIKTLKTLGYHIDKSTK